MGGGRGGDVRGGFLRGLGAVGADLAGCYVKGFLAEHVGLGIRISIILAVARRKRED